MWQSWLNKRMEIIEGSEHILLLLRSSVVSFNVPAQQAYIKKVVTDNQLLKASSYTSIVFQMCKVMGPILGAAVLIYTSARACLLINALSFLLSTLILLTLPKDRIKKDGTQEETPKHWTNDLTEGAKYVWSIRLMRITLAIVMLWFFCSILRQAQLAIFLKYLLPHKQNALGLFMGLDGLGAVTSSIFISRKKNIANHHLYFFLGFLLLASGILGVGLYQASWPHYILYLFAIVIGLGTGIQLVNYSYILKKETPKQQIGRVSGIATALQSCALTLGTLSSGFLVLWFGIREVYLGLAVVMLILAISSLVFIHK
ncbi:MAG: MFS transporter [Gammaproteobacteria bacterium]|nr:MFS transporter [Gammaproteobacteria bacterium]